MELLSTKLKYELDAVVAQKKAEIAAAVAAERKEALEDIRSKVRYFKISYRELKSHLIRTPDDKKKKTAKTKTRKQKFDVYGEQPQQIAKK
jgi:hypothetical protein